MGFALSARRFGALTAISALVASLMVFWSPAQRADASLGFDNARMADIALSYVGQPGVNACLAAGQGTAYAGQCKQFVNCIIVLSGGPMPGGGNDYAGSFIAAGGTEISEGAATKGDIIQWGSGSTTSQHTAIVVANLGGGRFDVVDSNWGTPGLMVKHHTITNIHADIFNGAGAQPTRFIRMGTVNGGGLADGRFVSYNGDVFRIAGGAPVYVSNWDHVGGNPGNVRALTTGEFAALRQYPVDGTLISGWAPGDPDHGSVYRVAGGAPIYVSSWSHIGGDPGTTVGVDLFAIKHAGGGGVLDHLRQRPVDGTLISGWAPGDPDHGSVYRVAGGAPIYVSNWSHIGGDPGTTVGVDLAAIRNAGSAGVWNHLLYRPSDGTYLKAGSKTYRVSKGAPILQSAPHDGVVVDPVAIANAGKPGVWSHLAAPPSEVPVVQPEDPAAVQLATQTVKVQRKTVKKGRSVRLPAATSQGARLTWSAWPKRVCSVTGRRLKAKRKGLCRIGGLAPAVPGFSSFATTRVVRVR